MARLMLSCGMFSALAAATAPRSRGLASTSPPPWRAAMVISLIRRVKILPRLASSAPFLCLIVAHLEWPDIKNLGSLPGEFCGEMLENNAALEQLPQLGSIAGPGGLRNRGSGQAWPCEMQDMHPSHRGILRRESVLLLEPALRPLF